VRAEIWPARHQRTATAAGGSEDKAFPAKGRCVEGAQLESGAGATGNSNLINNRQGGRRRGRGGQRPQGMPGNTGNARDNRQRGNAAQLHEKYKNMARDSQLAGDRVQTEYYLQFADHYFRVLGESRSRYEEQRRQRGDDGTDEEEEFEAAEADDEQQPRRQERPERQDRSDEPRRARANGRQRVRDEDDGDGERIAFDALPPAIAPDSSEAEASEGEERPRRRTRRARPAEDESEATAG
jgi:hypothetical protein